MSKYVYSFLDVQASIVGPGGAFSLGAGAGNSEEGITIESAGDKSGMQVGADGYGQHSLYGDKSGTVTIRLLKTSPVNRQLMQLYNFQTGSSATHGQNTINVSDPTRGDVVACLQSAFKKAPNVNFQKEAGFNEWVFDSIRIERTLGDL